MAWYLAALLLIGCLAAGYAIGLPAAFSFFAINVVGAWHYLGGDAGLAQLVRNGVASITNFSLTPIPFFVLMGEVLFHTGVAMKAIDAIARLIRRVPGRLAVVAVVAGTVFSAISGSTIATTAMLGSLLVAGIVPGVLLAVIYVLYIVVRAGTNSALAPAYEVEDRSRGWERWRPLLVYVTPLVLIFVVVIAVMAAGWATPTESAAIGAVATVLVAWVYRSISFASLMKALLGTAAISGVILFIIVGATTFSQVLTFSGATNGVISAIQQASLGPWGVLIGMLAILLVLGCFIDQVSMMLLTLPFFMPLVQHYGFDPLWFGVLFLIGMQLGLLMPPFGMLLFVMKSVAPKQITIVQIYRAVVPYLVFGVLMLVAVMLLPALALWLPRAIFE